MERKTDMQDTLIYLGVVVVVIAAAYGLMAIKPGTRKYLKYIWILIPAAVVILLTIIVRRKGVKTKGGDLRDTITGIKEKLVEVNLVAAVEVSAAKQKNADKIVELKKVTAIKDDKERRRRLIDLGE